MKTLFIGQYNVHLNTVNSTNSYATELVRNNPPPDGALIYTYNQTNGRGQRGTTWESNPNDNIALSIVVYPTFVTANEQFLLSKITALAMADLLAELIEPSDKTGQIRIKWPNDIYINKKKVAGILIENILNGSTIKSSVIGIGINVNQTTFSSELNATSLIKHTSNKIILDDIVSKLASYFEARYLQLKSKKTEQIDNEYSALLFQKDEWCNYQVKDERITGKIKGVSENGKLLLENKRSEILSFNLKEITFLL